MYRPKQIDEHLSVVETPATEFMLEIISVKKGETAKIPTLSVPRILIGFKGVGSHPHRLRYGSEVLTGRGDKE